MIEAKVRISDKAVSDVMALFVSVIDQYVVEQDGVIPDYMEVETIRKLPLCEVVTKIRVDFTIDLGV